MLISLSIRDVVLIDRLDLEFKPGLGVLTGETGAGKSILLDSLGLVLGERGDSGLVRQGASEAVVTAAFTVPEAHAVWTILDETGIPKDDPLVLRRSVSGDGRSRAFVNDQPVSVALLRRLGTLLVEIHGQRSEQGLLDPKNHRRLLDLYGGINGQAIKTAALYRRWKDAQNALAEARRAHDALKSEEEYVRHVVEELDTLAPAVGEEESLANERLLLMHGEKIVEAINEADGILGRDDGAERSIRAALRILERVAEQAGGTLQPVIDGLDRASVELAEAMALLQTVGSNLEIDSGRLEHVEERLFALRAAARKHGVSINELPALARTLSGRLAELEAGGRNLEGLTHTVSDTRHAYEEAARTLSTLRQEAACRLDDAVARELMPLKLDKATFRTRLALLPEEEWSADGAEKVVFEVSTNPGAPLGPLVKIASGGELSRFSLALKVALSEKGSATTLVFDEVDQGVGGAVASAVGDRLARLAADGQVVVVTHSPQVAAMASSHWRVAKLAEDGAMTRTTVAHLDDEDRREEIARMLAGARITNEARAAAASLLAR